MEEEEEEDETASKFEEEKKPKLEDPVKSEDTKPTVTTKPGLKLKIALGNEFEEKHSMLTSVRSKSNCFDKKEEKEAEIRY